MNIDGIGSPTLSLVPAVLKIDYCSLISWCYLPTCIVDISPVFLLFPTSNAALIRVLSFNVTKYLTCQFFLISGNRPRLGQFLLLIWCFYQMDRFYPEFVYNQSHIRIPYKIFFVATVVSRWHKYLTIIITKWFGCWHGDHDFFQSSIVSIHVLPPVHSMSKGCIESLLVVFLCLFINLSRSINMFRFAFFIMQQRTLSFWCF